MHWKVLPYCSDDRWEPPELRELKSKLANVDCDCTFCELYRASARQIQQPVDDQHKNQEVQSDCCLEPARPEVVLVNDATTADDLFLPSTNSNLFYKGTHQMCPSCTFTLSLLQNRATKVLKNEETEMKSVINTSDKATNNIVECLEKTTSYCKPVLKHPFNCSTCSDMTSDESYIPNRSSREVTFAFKDKYYGSESSNEQGDEDELQLIPSPERINESSGSTSPICMPVDINRYINFIKPPGCPGPMDPDFYKLNNM